jgi:CRP-like cAMP-binding protein
MFFYFNPKRDGMDNYKKRVQVKQYAMANDLFFTKYFHRLLPEVKNLSFGEMDQIKLPFNQPMLYFLNKGSVVATGTKGIKDHWYRLVTELNVFGDIGQISGIAGPRFLWFALSSVDLMAIPIQTLQDVLADNPEYLQKLKIHLASLESIRMNHLNILSKLSANEKLQYLEVNMPDILVKVNYQYIAKYLGLSRETISRLLKANNFFPGLI